jgi:molybdenum cofactor guanylyltransferase
LYEGLTEFAVTKPVRVGGIVLCGGQSRRMGRSKAWLPIGSETFLQRVTRIVAEVVQPTVVVAAAGQELPPLPTSILVARDSQPGRGPLQGLLAGLERLAGVVDAVYVSSCDAPLLRPAFVRRMIDLLSDFDIAVPETDGLPHPLAGVYRTKVREGVRELLDADRLRTAFLFERYRTRFVPTEELRAVDEDLSSLRNINTPEEYDALLRQAAVEDCPRGEP